MHLCIPRLSHTSTDTTFFQQSVTSCLTCITGERSKNCREESLSQPGINLQPFDHASDTLPIELSGKVPLLLRTFTPKCHRGKKKTSYRINPFLHIYSFYHNKKKALGKHC